MTAPGVHDVWLHSLASDLGRQLQNEITFGAHFFLWLHLSQLQKPWIFMHTFNIIVIYSASFSISEMNTGSGWNWRVHLYYSQKISAPSLWTELLHCLFPQCLTLSTNLLLELWSWVEHLSQTSAWETTTLLTTLHQYNRVKGSADCGWEAFIEPL